ncbi:MAG TPA: GYD domain-containing protein [Streptosporangiaceae bacterium]|nr:GYD domain-containing protein [Streptosporangiaceae bacterium]
MAKYLLLFNFTGETIRRFVAKPSDRAAVVRALAESVGGNLESYYWMFGHYDGAGVLEMPDSRTMAAVSLAAASSGAFTHLETHELIEADDLGGIAERAREIAYQPPGA